MESPTYSIVIPAYNESERISATLDKVLAYVAAERWCAEIIVVNDGSRDNTSEIVQHYAASHPQVRLLENPGNRGKGYSVRNGMLNAEGNILLFSDADLSSPIQESSKLFTALHNGADVAIGSRWLQAELQTQRQSFFRQLIGRVFNLLLRMILGLKYKDTQCGFKAFTRQSAEKIFTRQHIERWGFDPELLFLADKFRLRVAEVPVEWAHDERSKINPVVDGFKMGMEMLKVRWNSILGRYTRPSFAISRHESSTPLVHR
ncbi:MAG TPA: dolichyl-phosphate beta-glucosyltransferase [Clostridia bacterium]|nr:dolichyl-phosphate beta-glucosyltransferase [Clostridia bacterium]